MYCTGRPFCWAPKHTTCTRYFLSLACTAGRGAGLCVYLFALWWGKTGVCASNVCLPVCIVARGDRRGSGSSGTFYRAVPRCLSPLSPLRGSTYPCPPPPAYTHTHNMEGWGEVQDEDQNVCCHQMRLTGVCVCVWERVTHLSRLARWSLLILQTTPHTSPPSFCWMVATPPCQWLSMCSPHRPKFNV